MSMSGELTTAFQSVEEFFQPSWTRACSRAPGSRPTIVCISTSAGKLKNLGAWRHAFEWALPMKRYPIIPTLKVLGINKVDVESGDGDFIVTDMGQVNDCLGLVACTQWVEVSPGLNHI